MDRALDDTLGGRLAASGLPAEAFAAALAGLPGMGPARLSAVLRAAPAALAWERIRGGTGWRNAEAVAALGARPDALLARWGRAARGVEPVAVWRAIVDEGVGVAVIGSPAYPPALAADIEPPGVVFHRGSPDVVAGPRVAVVGTRRCSSTGAAIAWELGRDLAAAGVSVVSGLAAGIDGAGHRGALVAVRDGAPAAPIGVVGSGLDVVYPRGQAELWRAVASHGVLLSEAPLGARPERWRFPARNRIIAALADLVVVVESHRVGGSMHTVDEADRRGIDVMAVPGSVRAPASAGTNGLLAEGRAPVCSADDVLVALGMRPAGRRSRDETRRRPDTGDVPVLDAVGWQPATLDQIGVRTGHDLAVLAPALDRLCESGWVARRGGWYERVAGGAP
ncbi:MAG TPA: DNA-processing protein DprA [Acidimicrobiales bacterium]|nr:DNA-processing protein DprA [Acidimicrobiales bacterium]